MKNVPNFKQLCLFFLDATVTVSSLEDGYFENSFHSYSYIKRGNFFFESLKDVIYPSSRLDSRYWSPVGFDPLIS